MFYYTNYSSKVGKLTIVSDEKNIVGLWIENQKYFCSNMPSGELKEEETPILRNAKTWLDKYFKGEKPNINELSLKPEGSEFRKLVWKFLCDIPYGKTITYKEIAEKVAKAQGKEKTSAQAVGGAVGHNPISIIIPCHRVVGTDGNLTGYAGGIDIKIKLLAHEKVDMKNLYIPRNKEQKHKKAQKSIDKSKKIV